MIMGSEFHSAMGVVKENKKFMVKTDYISMTYDLDKGCDNYSNIIDSDYNVPPVEIRPTPARMGRSPKKIPSCVNWGQCHRLIML